MNTQGTNSKPQQKGASLSPKNNSNKKWIVTVVIAVIVIVGGWWAYRQFIVKPADEKAQTQLTDAYQYMAQAQQAGAQYAQIESTPDTTLTRMLQSQGLIKASTPDSLAIKVKDYRSMAKKEKERAYQAALKGEGKFPGLIKLTKGSGDAANIACYLAGVTYFNMGNYKEAIKYLEDFSPKGDAGVSSLALMALANSYACDKQIDKAIETFKKAAEKADNETFSPAYLIEAGKLLESQNKKTEAHAIYEEVKREYPQYGMSQQGMGSSVVDEYLERTK